MTSDASAIVATWSIYVVSLGTAECGSGVASNASSAVGRTMGGMHLVVKVRAIAPSESSVAESVSIGAYAMVARFGPMYIEPY